MRTPKEIRSVTRNNQLEPNEFFSQINDPSENDTDSQVNSLDFAPVMSDAERGDEENYDEEFDPMLNI